MISIMAQSIDDSLGARRTVRQLPLNILLVPKAIHQVHRLFLTLHLQGGHIHSHHIAQLWETAGSSLVQLMALVLEAHPPVCLAFVGVAVRNGAALRQDQVLVGLAGAAGVDQVAATRVGVVDVA